MVRLLRKAKRKANRVNIISAMMKIGLSFFASSTFAIIVILDTFAFLFYFSSITRIYRCSKLRARALCSSSSSWAALASIEVEGEEEAMLA